MKKLGVLGATGKMGQAVLQLEKTSFWQLIPVPKTASFHGLAMAIDFSHVDACERHLSLAKQAEIPLIIGTTGHTESTYSLMQEVSLHIPLLYSTNFSIGIALMKKFFKEHLHLLSSGYIDIFETHHTEKKDLPSGTSLDLAQLFKHKNISITSPSHRSQSDLVIHPQRIPHHPGEHTVQCSLEEETLSFHHQVKGREVYAKGALLAADFLIHQTPGLYSFSDVFAAQNYSFAIPSDLPK